MTFIAGLSEPDAKYRYLSLLVLLLLGPIGLGVFLWAAFSLSWWAALPIGIVSIGGAFLLLLEVVSCILPKKMPQERDW